MSKLPIFRLVHKDEADHHAQIVCKKRGYRKGTKKYNECYNQAFLQYIDDARESLYPSGEIQAGSNPQNENISMLEKIRRRNPLYGKLSKQEFDKLKASKEWKYLSKLNILKHDYDKLFNKHINRGSKSPSELEEKKLKNLERRITNHLKKEHSLSQSRLMAKKIMKQSASVFKKNYEKLMKRLIKEKF